MTIFGQGFHGLGGNTEFASCRFVTSNHIADTPPIELLPERWTCRSPNQVRAGLRRPLMASYALRVPPMASDGLICPLSASDAL